MITIEAQHGDIFEIADEWVSDDTLNIDVMDCENGVIVTYLHREQVEELRDHLTAMLESKS